MFNPTDMLPVKEKNFTLQAVYEFGEHYELSVVSGGCINGYEICLFHHGRETPFTGMTEDNPTKDGLDESDVILVMSQLRMITGYRPKQV